jgi:ribosome-binding protein aMBF1 (putative translation factor)
MAAGGMTMSDDGAGAEQTRLTCEACGAELADSVVGIREEEDGIDLCPRCARALGAANFAP